MHGLMMDYQLTIDRILEHGARQFGHKRIATKLPSGALHEYSYADLLRRTKRLANVLLSLGIQPGDRVATFAWNNYQHLEMYYAIPGAARSATRSTFVFRPTSLPTSSTTPRIRSSSSMARCCRSSSGSHPCSTATSILCLSTRRREQRPRCPTYSTTKS